MKKLFIFVLTVTVLNVITISDCFAERENYSQDGLSGTVSHDKFVKEKTSCFSDVCAIAPERGGVKEITYEQFQKIRNSGEKYELVDALSAESYAKGHIEGAISFPYNTIDLNTAPSKLGKADNIIVYCGGFKCAASTKAAHRLMALGYKNVVDYKGGLEEWQAKGNALVK